MIKRGHSSRRLIRGGVVAAFATVATVAIVALMAAGDARAADEAHVIELTQTGCQFIESENGVDHGFAPQHASDCKQINSETGNARLEQAKVLKLEPGEYVFRITNQNVPYELGFWLRGDGLISRASLPSVSGGGLTEGKTQDYVITLEPGEYVYSCPLNPTPDYKLIVEG